MGNSSWKIRFGLILLIAALLLAVNSPAGALSASFQEAGSPTATPSATPSASPTEPAAIPASATLTQTGTAAAGVDYGWLSSPEFPTQLASNRALVFLAGHLIMTGQVDISACPSGAVLSNGAASQCGLEQARYQVYLWQNQFDTEIYNVALKQQVPAFLLKNLFLRESQMWPATKQNSEWDFGEFGLGQMNEKGADTLLMWNGELFNSLCKSIYTDNDTCWRGYVGITTQQQSMLRGMALRLVRADCEGCSFPVDVKKAQESINVFAQALLANRQQVHQVLRNLTATLNDGGVSYPDLWKFTLTNYHAGPGCLNSALGATRLSKEALTWKNVKKHFEPVCADSVNYVDEISSLPPLGSVPVQPATATLEPSQTPTPSLTPSPTSLTPAATETATIEISSTPTASFTPSATSTETPTPFATPTTIPAGGSAAQSSDEIVVKFNGLVPDLISNAIVASAGGQVQDHLDALGLTVISVPAGQADQVAAQLSGNLLVVYAEPNDSMQAFFAPNDPGFPSQQNYLAAMQVPAAWDITRGQGVIVAVIDTGVDVSHPDLSSRLWVNPGETGMDASGSDKRTNGLDDDGNGYVDDWQGWNFVDNNGDVSDLNGHGTHIAGIIAASMDNGAGVAGIAPEAHIMALKALDDSGRGSYASVAAAITYAVDHGARIINLGFGGAFNSDTLRAATDYAYAHNVLVVAAAGNTGSNMLIYPAANPNVIGVSALDADQKLASFSTFGASVSLAAPGVGIYSTLPGGLYNQMSGTSMSSAQVAGVAALLASQPQFDTPDKIRAALFGTALDLGDPGVDPYFGHGMVQAYTALIYTPNGLATPLPSITPTASATPDGTLTPFPAASETPVDGGVTVMALDAAGSVITRYASSCGTQVFNTPLGGTRLNGVESNGGGRNTIALPFEFWYMGSRYTQVIVSSSGWISLGNATNNYINNDLDNSLSLSGAARPFIAPLWDSMSAWNSAAGGRVGTASYTITNTPTGRVLTVEWWHWIWNPTAGATPMINVRATLSENTGVITFNYSATTAAAIVNSGSASIGLTGGTGTTSFISAQSVAACPSFTSPEVDTLNTKPADDTLWSFTPPVLPAPTGFYLTAINSVANTQTLNWSDNASSELGYVIYNSVDNGVYNYVTALAPNTTTYNAPITNGASLPYYWKVYALSEGALSGGITRSQPLSPPVSLSFTNIGSNSLTLNWLDMSTVETGYQVYRSSDNVTFSRVGSLPADSTSFLDIGLTSSTNYYYRVYAVGPNAISTALSGFQSTGFAVQVPVVAISAPATGSTYKQGEVIGFIGSAIVPTSADVGNMLIWSSSPAGISGSGASFGFNTSSLAPGAYTVTASAATDGGTASASVVINITSNPSPHDSFVNDTQKCALCHRSHTARSGPTTQLNDASDPLTSNTFCLSCHQTDANAVSTHSNMDRLTANTGTTTDGGWGVEQKFELVCLACHDPHAQGKKLTPPQLAAIRQPDQPGPKDDKYAGVRVPGGTLKANVTFTAFSGANSYDDGTGTGICVVCHSSTANPNFLNSPMINHVGGAGHSGASPDYTGQDCIRCHSHSVDTKANTRDGFMTGCRGCHSQPQDIGRTPINTGRRQVVGDAVIGNTGGDFNGGSHHVAGNDIATDADCQVCHEMSQHKQGKVRLFNQDTPATVYSLDCGIQRGTSGCAPNNSLALPNNPADYQAFCLSCHDGNGAGGNLTPFSDKVVAPALNTTLWSTAVHAIAKSSPVFNGSCLDCHSNGHGSSKSNLLSRYNTSGAYDWQTTATANPDVMAQEEDFCFKCHNAAGIATDAQAVFTDPSINNTFTAFYKHDVSATYDVHDPKEVLGTSFAGANRHVECADCHGTHAENLGTTAAPNINPSNLGASGVSPVYTGAGLPASYNFKAAASYEYEFCLKCHSSYTTVSNYLPDGYGCATPCGIGGTKTLVADGLPKLTHTANNQVPDSRDMAQEFNPANASFHPLMAVGKNTSIPAASFVAGWSVTSRVYCSDCHASATPAAIAGPHSSPLLHILGGANGGATDYSTVSPTSKNQEPVVPDTEICFKCHDYATYVTSASGANTNFRDGTGLNLHMEHMNDSLTTTTCYTCHDTHGSEQQHLINFDASVAVPVAGFNSQSAWRLNTTTNVRSCYVSCHGMTHNPQTYTP